LCPSDQEFLASTLGLNPETTGQSLEAKLEDADFMRKLGNDGIVALLMKHIGSHI
jgi:hypothetical protein